MKQRLSTHVAILAILAIVASGSVGGLSPARAAAATPPAMTGYVPLPANEMQGAMKSVSTAAGTTLDYTVGITSAGSGAVVYYDQWEDGYESSIGSPSQASTLVFGDGNPSNGDASQYCSRCTGDLLPQGASMILRNNVPTPRVNTSILFDGGDKVASNRSFTITAGGFTTSVGSLLAGVVSSYDTSKYGTDFTIPVGENTPVPANTTNAFSYTGLIVQASADNTVVQVDKDANGATDVTQTINEGKTVFVNGGVKQGATVHASQPVQVQLATGQKGSAYESRWYTLFADSVLSSDYMSPAGSGVNNFRTVNYLYNRSSSPITITPTCASCTGTISVPAKSSAAFHSPTSQAVRFVSSGGEPFVAIAGVGAQSGAAPGNGTNQSSTWDWGFTMVPTSELTTQVLLGWAPGNSNAPPASPSTDRDDDPVWVTTLKATTLHVDFDGDPSTGTINTTDCVGAHHDQDIAVAALASTRIYDANDGDMTGARIYTCDGTVVSGAWGEDPSNAPSGSPGFDAGYTLIPTPALIVNKTAALTNDVNGDGKVSPGDTITYDVSVANVGTMDLTSLKATDTLPGTVTYVPNSTKVGSSPIADAGTTPFPLDEGGASLPTIAPGDIAHVTFDATVEYPYRSSDPSIDNRVCVDGAGPTACDTTTTDLSQADLELTKAQVGTPQYAGDNAIWRVTLTNKGPDIATDIQVADAVPDGTTYQSSAPSQGSYSSTAGVWSVGTLANGASATLDITTRMDATSAVNFAQVSQTKAVDIDSQPSENALDATHPPDQDDEASATANVTAAADLELSKTVSSAPKGPGDTEFTLHLVNKGPNAATNVAVSDYPPDGGTYVSSTPSSGSFDGTSGVWTIPSIANGADATLTVTYRLTKFPARNRAEVTHSDQFDPDSQPKENAFGPTDDPDQDDEAGVTVGDPKTDLSLTKVATSEPKYIGDNVTYKIEVTNNGPVDAGSVTVADRLPDGLTFISSNPSEGTYDQSTGTWTVGTIANGDKATLSLTARLDVPSVTNTAQISGADRMDPDSTPNNDDPNEDDQASVTTHATGGSIGDRVWLDTSGDGKQDAGENGISGVVVTLRRDADGDGTYETVVGSQPTGPDGKYDFTDLPPGSYRVDVDKSTLPVGMVETDTISGKTTLAGGQSIDDVDFGFRPQADLELTKIETAHPTFVGQNAVFVLTLTNKGPAKATGVRVLDSMPAGLHLVEASSSLGSFDASTGIWDGLTLPVNGTATLTLTARVDSADPQTNVAQVISSDEADPDSVPGNDVSTEDDQASASVDVDPLADLSLTKKEIGHPVHVGDLATYEIDLTNHGPSTATGVEVTEGPTSGLDLRSTVPSQGTYDDKTNVWSVGTIANGDTATLTVVAKVTSITADNFAQVTKVNEKDPDSQPDENPLGNGNDPDQDDEAHVHDTVKPLIDLSLGKTSTPSKVDVLGQATFKLTLHNAGPSDATSVEVTDKLPLTVLFLSSDPSAGTYDPTSGVWTVGNVPSGGTVTLSIAVQALGIGDTTNTAQVTKANEDDVDSTPGNDNPSEDDQDSTTLSAAPIIDLSVAKTVSPATVIQGGRATYTVTVRNDGPSDATGVELRDTLPSGASYVSHSADVGTFDPATGVWSVGGVANGASHHLDITVRADKGGDLTNFAEVIKADQRDADSQPAENTSKTPDQDDEATATLTSQPLADLSLVKTADNAAPALGSVVTYTLKLTNHGPSGATGVVVSDKLPAGLTYVSDTSRGRWNHTTGDWTIGSLAADGTASMNVVARVASAGSIANTARVTKSNEPDPDSTPGNTDPREDDQSTVTIKPTESRVNGLLWLDKNGDSVRNRSETTVLPGVVVRLLDGGGRVIANTVTGPDGTYSFDHLPPGNYTVAVDPTTLPAYVDRQSHDPDGVLDNDHGLVLPSGASVGGIDFGYTLSNGANVAVNAVTVPLGRLPRTGAPISTYVTFGLTLLFAGFALRMGARRRRPS